VQEFFQGLSCKRKLSRFSTFESNQREADIGNVLQRLSPSGKTLVQFVEVFKEGMNG
jgi:hypothetical protein